GGWGEVVVWAWQQLGFVPVGGRGRGWRLCGVALGADDLRVGVDAGGAGGRPHPVGAAERRRRGWGRGGGAFRAGLAAAGLVAVGLVAVGLVAVVGGRVGGGRPVGRTVRSVTALVVGAAARGVDLPADDGRDRPLAGAVAAAAAVAVAGPVRPVVVAAAPAVRPVVVARPGWRPVAPAAVATSGRARGFRHAATGRGRPGHPQTGGRAAGRAPRPAAPAATATAPAAVPAAGAALAGGVRQPQAAEPGHAQGGAQGQQCGEHLGGGRVFRIADGWGDELVLGGPLLAVPGHLLAAAGVGVVL